MSLLPLLRKQAPLILVATFPFVLGSCVGPALLGAQSGALGALGRTGGAQAQDKFQQDQQNTVNQGTAAGAGIGALAGAALSQRFGLAGVLVGAAVGAAAGNAFGQHVAMKKALAAQSSANLDAAIKEAESENAAARKRVAGLRSQLDDLKTKARAAKAKGDAKAVSKIKAEMQDLDKKVLADRKAFDGTISMQTQLQSKVPSGNASYASISSGLSESTKTRASYDSLHNEIGSALNEF